MSRKILAALFLGLMFMAGTSYSAYADMRGCGCQAEGGMHQNMEMGKRGMRMWMVFKGLGLNEQQKDAIGDIRSGLMKETVRKRADIRIARIELRELLQKDNVDMGAVEGKLKQIASLQTDLRLSHIKAMVEIKSKLTAEQRLKLKENFRKYVRWMHKERHEGMCGMEKMGMRHHGEGGMRQPAGQ